MNIETVGPDPHGALCTGTGHSKEDAKGWIIVDMKKDWRKIFPGR